MADDAKKKSVKPTRTTTTTTTTTTLNNGVHMPLIGLGTWKSPLGKTKQAVYHAVKNAGYRLIDTANDYNNEHEIGEALKKLLDEGVVKREDLFIQSKLWNSNHKAEFVKPDLLATLKDLNLDYIDSFIIHWPQACPATGKAPAVRSNGTHAAPASEGTMFPYDPETLVYCSDNDTHFAETWTAMEKLVDEGLVKSIGLSNFNKTQIQEILRISKKHKPAILQNECHPYLQQKDLVVVLPATVDFLFYGRAENGIDASIKYHRVLLQYDDMLFGVSPFRMYLVCSQVDFCNFHGIIFQAYSPLSSKDRPAHFRKKDDPELLEDPNIRKMSKKYNKSPAQIVLHWHIAAGHAAVPKSVTPSRIEENIQVFDFQLSKEEMDVISAMNCGWRILLWPHTATHPDYPFKDELPFGHKVGSYKRPMQWLASSSSNKDGDKKEARN